MKNKPYISNKMNNETYLSLNLAIKHKEFYRFAIMMGAMSLSDKNVNKDRLMYNLLESGT